MLVYDEKTSRQAKCRDRRAWWVGWVALLPMTRRRDTVGTANWPTEGGARRRVVHGAGLLRSAPRSAPDRALVDDLIDAVDQS